MDEIDRKVRAETNHLVLARTQVMVIIVVLGILAGDLIDLWLGRALAYPHRRLVNLAGLLAMAGLLYATRHPGRVASPRRIAFGAAAAVCVFMLALSSYAGPDAETVTLLAYTVITLGTAILLPWGIGLQVGLVAIVWVAVHVSLYFLHGRPVPLDPSGAEVIVPKEWPPALGYAPWVEEVWANYISNAIKYGGARPRVELGANRDGTARFTSGSATMVADWTRNRSDACFKSSRGSRPAAPKATDSACPSSSGSSKGSPARCE